jgi:hypothetical protein
VVRIHPAVPTNTAISVSYVKGLKRRLRRPIERTLSGPRKNKFSDDLPACEVLEVVVTERLCAFSGNFDSALSVHGPCEGLGPVPANVGTQPSSGP